MEFSYKHPKQLSNKLTLSSSVNTSEMGPSLLALKMRCKTSLGRRQEGPAGEHPSSCMLQDYCTPIRWIVDGDAWR